MEASVFVVEWLRDQVVIERGKLPPSVRTISDAIQAAHIQSIAVKARLPDREPDSLRLSHKGGKDIGTFRLRK